MAVYILSVKSPGSYQDCMAVAGQAVSQVNPSHPFWVFGTTRSTPEDVTEGKRRPHSKCKHTIVQEPHPV
jgi:hypothetical protein